jgi:hypothetical protein
MKRFLFSLIVLALGATLAGCGGGGGTAGGASGSAGGAYDTEFPLPPSVSNFTATGSSGINFQTKMSLEDAIAFYRDALTSAGMTERTINTAITETTFSLVFDGDPSGKAVVVQGVDLGDGTTNVNVRYEDV